MKRLIGKVGITQAKPMKRYSIIILVINSLHTRAVKKRFLNFYNPILPDVNGIRPNETRISE